MSGIVGIINLNGAPVDRDLLRRMTQFMAYRGPDAQELRIDGHVGFGHTMLRATFESAREQQPCSLDGKVWITADARIDGRTELIHQLKAKGCHDLVAATDVELILHAYHVWAEDCVKHLLGDFAFAIWDKARRRLFCARDHFGVKPFYYARVEDSLIFSNTLNCVRLHPAVSDELNDLAIADFLLFDINQDPSTTTFADIQRLRPAHCFICSEGRLKENRYWTLPTNRTVRYRKRREYLDHFKELFSIAVSDRLRANNVGIFMSGGLDSTSVAATAHEFLSKQSQPFELQAYTVVYDRLIPDRERYYSGLAAKALGIGITHFAMDDYALYERWDDFRLNTPEPLYELLGAATADQYERCASRHRVALTGFGGDSAFVPSLAYFSTLLNDVHLAGLAAEYCRYFFSRRRLPKFGVREWLRNQLGTNHQSPSHYPLWLRSEFETRLDLPLRWQQFSSEPEPIHPIRPEAYQSLTACFWTYRLENCDAGITGVACELRHPFFDVRLLDYLLAIPPIPWCAEKDILRMAMRGMLPEKVRRRPKTPLSGDPISKRLQDCGERWWRDHFQPTSALEKYVEPTAVLQNIETDSNSLWVNLRPLSLNYWLKQRGLFNRAELRKEGFHGSTKRTGEEKTLSPP